MFMELCLGFRVIQCLMLTFAYFSFRCQATQRELRDETFRGAGGAGARAPAGGLWRLCGGGWHAGGFRWVDWWVTGGRGN